jgi:hypothetical protein
MFDTTTGIAPNDQTDTPRDPSSTPAPSTATRLARLSFMARTWRIVAGKPSPSALDDATPEQIEFAGNLALSRYIVGEFHP